MRNQNKRKCYMHIGSLLGIFLGVISRLMFEFVPLGICVALGLMFGAAIGGIVDGSKETV